MDLLFHRPFIVPILLLIFLAFLPVPSFGCGFTFLFDNWNMTDNDSTLLQTQPRYHITLNPTFEFVVPTTLHVQFSNVSILDTWNLDSGFSDHTFAYLSKPFEIYVDSNGSILHVEFLDKLDIEESRVVKQSILDHLWDESDFFGRVGQCFCSPSEHQRPKRLADNEPGPSCSTKKVVADSVNAQDATFDNWLQRGYVTKVKSQGDCNVCWAFGVTGMLEAYDKLKCEEENKGKKDKEKVECKLHSFSEQWLMEKAKGHKQSSGCVKDMERVGGTVDLGFNLIRSSGIYHTEDYPWVGRDREPVRPPNKNYYYEREQIKKRPIKQGNVKDIKAALKHGPVAGVIKVGNPSLFRDWETVNDKGKKTGVDVRRVLKASDKSQGAKKTLGHVILIVAHGVYRGEAYWLIKNSWGPKWGEQGYVKLSVKENENLQLQDLRYILL